MHMTHTELGHTFDNDMMAVATYAGYQTLVSHLNVTSAAVLSVNKNLSDAREIVEKFAFMPLEQPDASTWLETLQLGHADYQFNPYMMFGAIGALFFSMILPHKEISHFIVKKFTRLVAPGNKDPLSDLPAGELKDWAEHEFAPAVFEAMEPIRISATHRMRLAVRLFGALAKIAWAFLFQERFVPVPHVFHQHFFLRIAAHVMPLFNRTIDKLTGMPFTDLGVYPGAAYCNLHSPHAIWHQQTSVGFYELIMLADYGVGLLK